MSVSKKQKVVHGPGEGKFEQQPNISALKQDLTELASSKDPKDDPAYSMALMTHLYPEIAKAFQVGATQRQVHALFSKHQIKIPFTRFIQNLAKLRALFPSEKTEVTFSKDEVIPLSNEIQSLSQ
jgi:hypothetical protein